MYDETGKKNTLSKHDNDTIYTARYMYVCKDSKDNKDNRRQGAHTQQGTQKIYFNLKIFVTRSTKSELKARNPLNALTQPPPPQRCPSPM